MNYYVMLDPGLTTGIARFDEKGILKNTVQVYGIVEVGDALAGILQTGHVKQVMYETFKVFNHVDLTGDDIPAAQVIGIIKYLTARYGVPCEGIQPKYKKIGYAWSGTRPPSDHSKSHGPDAAALGEYWLRKNGVKGIND